MRCFCSPLDYKNVLAYSNKGVKFWRMKKFGDKLKKLRSQRDLTLRELADLLGVGYGHVGRMEHGEKKPSIEVLIKIADVFGVTVDWLVRDELGLEG